MGFSNTISLPEPGHGQGASVRLPLDTFDGTGTPDDTGTLEDTGTLDDTESLPVPSRIVVRAGWIIDAIDVDGHFVGGEDGRAHVTNLGQKEKVTAIEFGYQSKDDFWPTGTMCSLTIFTNIGEYGPFAGRDSCQDVQRVEIPIGMSFQDFMKKSAEDIIDGSWGGTAVTIDRY